MEFEVTVKEISNGWIVEVGSNLIKLGDDDRPKFFTERDKALNYAADYLLMQQTGEVKK